MKEQLKSVKKRLIVEVTNELHNWIKKTALEKNMTMSWWLEEAIRDKQMKDKDLGF